MLLFFWWLAWKRRLVYLTFPDQSMAAGLVKWAVPGWVCILASTGPKAECRMIIRTSMLLAVQTEAPGWLDDLFKGPEAEEPPQAPVGAKL